VRHHHQQQLLLSLLLAALVLLALLLLVMVAAAVLLLLLLLLLVLSEGVPGAGPLSGAGAPRWAAAWSLHTRMRLRVWCRYEPASPTAR
jgi:hypothetical protein